MVKLELYRVFREVAEAGNISLAAQNLYLSQSAVSQSVKQLEQQLGTRLFLRSPRGVTLTEDGRLLFEYVRSAMGLLETGEDKVRVQFKKWAVSSNVRAEAAEAKEKEKK